MDGIAMAAFGSAAIPVHGVSRIRGTLGPQAPNPA